MFLKIAEKNDLQEQFTCGLFRYYVIYGQLLGVEDKVVSLLKKFHPEYLHIASYTYNDILNAIFWGNSIYEKIISVRRMASNNIND